MLKNHKQNRFHKCTTLFHSFTVHSFTCSLLHCSPLQKLSDKTIDSSGFLKMHKVAGLGHQMQGAVGYAGGAVAGIGLGLAGIEKAVGNEVVVLAKDDEGGLGDIAASKQTLQAFIEEHPKHPLAADARQVSAEL